MAFFPMYRRLLLIALILLGSTACGCVRYVQKGPDYGVVAMPMDTNVWPFQFRQKAEKLMQDHFPNGYVIENEGEAVVGQTIESETEEVDGPNYRKGNWSLGFGSSKTTSTINDQTEWRILYRAKK